MYSTVKNMTRKKEIIILIIMAAVLIGFWWVSQKSPAVTKVSPTVSEIPAAVILPETQTINICGNDYLTGKIDIGGVELIRRMVELSKQTDLCSAISYYYSGKEKSIDVGIKISTYPVSPGTFSYIFDFGPYAFFINMPDGSIWLPGMDGNELVGYLR